MGSHSRQYLNTGVIFLFFFYKTLGVRGIYVNSSIVDKGAIVKTNPL